MQNQKQLYCFTHAGGDASFFDNIKSSLPGIEVISLDYAGHGSRCDEDFYPDFASLADDLFEQIKTRIKGEYALLGYSMGSISAVEVLERILDSDIARPKHIFLAAHEPHTKSELLGFKEEEADEWVKRRTIEFGAIPERLWKNKVFWRVYLPLYRADYTVIAKYEFEKLDLKTDIPATFFYSETDTPREDMDLWKQFFIGECDYYQFEGNHFFINQHLDEITKIINEKLLSGRINEQDGR